MKKLIIAFVLLILLVGCSSTGKDSSSSSTQADSFAKPVVSVSDIEYIVFPYYTGKHPFRYAYYDITWTQCADANFSHYEFFRYWHDEYGEQWVWWDWEMSDVAIAEVTDIEVIASVNYGTDTSYYEVRTYALDGSYKISDQLMVTVNGE